MFTTPQETAVRMGELATTARPGEVISCVGIGSCIALLLMDRSRGVIGLAHVVMPDGDGHPPAKYATTVVPELIARTVATGAHRVQLRAALVGGASMFQFGALGPEQQIGARNERAVRAELALARIPVVDAQTGGTNGRSLRVVAGDPVVATVRSRADGDRALALDATPAVVAAGTRASEQKQTSETVSEVV